MEKHDGKTVSETISTCLPPQGGLLGKFLTHVLIGFRECHHVGFTYSVKVRNKTPGSKNDIVARLSENSGSWSGKMLRQLASDHGLLRVIVEVQKAPGDKS